MHGLILALLLLFAALTHLSLAAERPNILWIVSEDNAAHWLGCYGNQEAQTPHLDSLAARSTRFTAAYSNAPVCAVARSTILMGRYAPSMGTQHMRSRHPIPQKFTPYLTHLRKAGYYTSNASKTDYNFKGNDQALWDDCSPQAHYKNRPKNTPFFSIFNLTLSHESNLFPEKIAANRAKGLIPQIPRLDPTQLSLPPHLPDLPEIRQDFAIYHDTITALDRQIGQILQHLKKDGLADNTLIFYYGDHGGPTPRAKRYLYDTGVRVPMLIHIPKKWAKLSPFKNGSISPEPIAFIDLAPTLLSLLNLPKDPHYQGRAFLGPQRIPPPANHHIFLYADRFDEFYTFRRGLSNGRYKYIRNFTPHLWAAPYSFYQFQMSSWPAWQKAWKAGTLNGPHASLWENDRPSEELYDTQNDPWETQNLATDPAHTQRLAHLRLILRQKMTRIRDSALVPEPLFPTIAGQQTIAAALAAPDFPHQKLLNLAFLASSQDPKNLPALQKAAASNHPLTRYWGLSGLITLGEQAHPARLIIEQALTSPTSTNRSLAAHALARIGQKKRALRSLLQSLADPSLPPLDQALIINTLLQMREGKSIPESWKKRARQSPKSQPRLSDLADKLHLL